MTLRLVTNLGPDEVLCGPTFEDAAIRIPTKQVIYVPAEWVFWTAKGDRASIQMILSDSGDDS